MLVPAILHKNEILTKIQKYNYTEDMMYYIGYIGNSLPSIEENSDGSIYQYAIVDGGKLIGYFTYRVDWYSSCVYDFGLFSFDRNNITIGLDIYRELKKIINDYHIHRLEWRMIGGNPVEKHYDKFCQKYRGKKYVLTDVFKDRCGKYHNDVIYEIIF
nr:MAG TPA: ribosomal-protein-alanine acetyltransferase [Caudoviricetes sp.]